MRKPFLALGLAAAATCAVATVVLGAAAPAVSIHAFRGTAVGLPLGIAPGPDGALWFTNEQGPSIGRITANGALSVYSDPGIVAPSAITAGPDGALWFLNGAASIGRITTAGVVSTFAAPTSGSPLGIAPGPDGALWFTAGGKSIGRITTAGTVTIFTDSNRMRGTSGIAAGPDGALWFTNYLGSSIGRISVDGTVSTYTDPRIRYPLGIAAGPDGALWFADDSGSIGRITTSGLVTTFGDSGSVGHPFAIAAGPDGALWATDRGGSIVRITVGGTITRYTAPTVEFPVGIAAGRDGALWFADYTGNSIERAALVPVARKEPAPRLTVAAPGARSAPAARHGAARKVLARVHVDRRARLTLTAGRAGSRAALVLEPGSRLGAVVLKRPAKSMRISVSKASTLVVAAALPGRALVAGRVYRLVLDAVGGTGNRSRLTISFRG